MVSLHRFATGTCFPVSSLIIIQAFNASVYFLRRKHFPIWFHFSGMGPSVGHVVVGCRHFEAIINVFAIGYHNLPKFDVQ